MRSRFVARRSFVEELECRRLFALLQYDFNGAVVWPQVPGISTSGVTAVQTQSAVGTIDAQGSTTKTGGVGLAVSAAPSGSWISTLESGPLAVTNTETNLGKLTLSFNLSASQAKQVRLVVTSYNASNQRTGGLEIQLTPAAADFFQRFAVDLSTMKPSGSGTFNPAAPKIGFSFEMNSRAGWTAGATTQLRVDNVNYSNPKFYVSPSGNNTTGLSEATAFRTPQQAISAATAGDIILLMNGTYNQINTDSGALNINKTGTPAAWLVVKNYPGHTPLIYNEAWNAVNIGRGSSTTPSTAAALAYIEVRGLSVRGNGQTANTVYASGLGAAVPQTNGNGITVNGYYETNRPHHIRFADNFVEYACGGGVNALETDWVQIENNNVQNTSWWTRYGTSGISILSAYNFDGTTNQYTRLVSGNRSSGNQTFVPTASDGRFSDGNGIIIDVNHNTANIPTGVTVGRTLVTNNVCFNNGGSGIHSFIADHVDIFNNTVYMNSASPELQYAPIYAGSAGTAGSAFDVRIYNNIMVAPTAPTGSPAEPLSGGRVPDATNQVVYRNNIYWGGNTAPRLYSGDRLIDPKLVNPTLSPATADFRLQAISPAIDSALNIAPIPAIDLAGNFLGASPDIGAYQYVANLAAAGATGFEFSTRQALSFTFSNVANSIFSQADFTLENLTTGQTVAANVGTFSFNPAGTVGTLVLSNLLTDGNYRLTYNSPEVLSATGVATSMVPITFDFYVLGADANQDRKVDTVDFNILLANFGTAGRTFSEGNFNYDPSGIISSSDFNRLVTRFGVTVPAIPSALPLALPAMIPGSIFGGVAIDEDDSDPASASVLV